MEDDWVEKHGKAEITLLGVSHCLQKLAVSFDDTGNRIMCDKLLRYAKLVDKSREIRSKAVGQSIKEAIDRSETHSTTLLQATPAGYSCRGSNSNRILRKRSSRRGEAMNTKWFIRCSVTQRAICRGCAKSYVYEVAKRTNKCPNCKMDNYLCY